MQNKCMVHTVWLHTSRTNLHIVRKASLAQECQAKYFEPTFCLGFSYEAYPHSRVKSTGDIIILFQSRTASKNLWEPKLVDSTLDMGDFPLGWRWSLNPLRRLPTHSTNKISMCEGLWSPLLHLDVQGRGNWLCDPTMQRRSPARDR